MASDERLTPHFLLSEFRCHDGSPVPPEAIPALRRLCQEVLEPLRAKFGPVTIVSGFRTPAWNRQVKGARSSRHLYTSFPGSPAADIKCRRGRPREWYAWLNERHGGGLGVYPSHVHVDQRTRRARW